MPIYEYKCTNNKCENSNRFEYLHLGSNLKKLTNCPICNSLLENLMSPSSLKFCGTGFYCTDYPKEKKKSKKQESKTKQPKSEKQKENVKQEKNNKD